MEFGDELRQNLKKWVDKVGGLHKIGGIVNRIFTKL